jgi:hypothetical protein
MQIKFELRSHGTFAVHYFASNEKFTSQSLKYFALAPCGCKASLIRIKFRRMRNLVRLFVYSRTSNISAIWWLSSLPVTRLQILAYAQRSGPLSREGSLSCHTYCDTGPRFIGSHPKDRCNEVFWTGLKIDPGGHFSTLNIETRGVEFWP